LRFWFRAIQSNGLAVSLLSSDVAASQYLVVYLRAGHIVVSMASTSRRSTRLTSRDTYDDANWWQVASSSSSSSHTHPHPSLLQFRRDLKTALHVSVIVVFTVVFGCVTDYNCNL